MPRPKQANPIRSIAPFPVRLPADVRDGLQAVAAREERSAQAVAADAIARAVASKRRRYGLASTEA